MDNKFIANCLDIILRGLMFMSSYIGFLFLFEKRYIVATIFLIIAVISLEAIIDANKEFDL